VRYTRLWGPLALAITVVPFLPGCANLPVANFENPDDPCYQERKGLAAHQSYFTGDIIKGAAIGAIGGVVTGALAAAATGKDIGTGMAIGAVAGAVVGGIGGYYNALQRQQGQTPNAFYSTLLNDVQEENRRIQAINQSLDQLLACRKRQAAGIRVAYKHKRIDRSTGEQGLAELRLRIQEDLEVANSLRAGLGNRANDLQFASLKAAPGRIGYVDLNAQGKHKVTGHKKHKRSKRKTSPLPAEVQQALDQAPAAPKAKTATDKKLQARLAQSTSQIQDNVGKIDMGMANLAHVAEGGLEAAS